MNELIKQFKQQAGVDFNPDQEGLDLFAQLIVEECIRAIKNDNDIHLSIRDLSSEYKQGIQMGLEFAITDIKEHFGVKE